MLNPESCASDLHVPNSARHLSPESYTWAEALMFHGNGASILNFVFYIYHFCLDAAGGGEVPAPAGRASNRPQLPSVESPSP